MATLTVYDDPLNPHGWALQPALRSLSVSFPSLERRVRAVPLAEDWETYDGPEIRNGIRGMPATCAEVSERSGMPIDEYLWFNDPPDSSLPGCRAVAAASTLDGASPADDLARRTLRALQEATFLRRVNVADETGLRSTLADVPDLDHDAVLEMIADGQADEALDEHRSAGRSIEADGVQFSGDRPVLPTVVVEGDGDARGISGYRQPGRYRRAVEQVTGETVGDDLLDVPAALDRFSLEGWVAARELSELTGRPYDEAVAAARELGDTVVERTFASESFFRHSEYVTPDEQRTEAIPETGGSDADENV